MSVSLTQVLAPHTILKTISQLQFAGTSLCRLFGWGIGGDNVDRQSGRHFAFDIFNHTRKIATARVPAQAASRTGPLKMGHQHGTFPRSAECIPLLDEELLNRRKIGGPDSALDRGGATFITRQELYLAQRLNDGGQVFWGRSLRRFRRGEGCWSSSTTLGVQTVLNLVTLRGVRPWSGSSMICGRPAREMGWCRRGVTA